jgi:hypothetical protein
MPAVSRSAQWGTNGMIEVLAACFTGLEDPRETRRCDHQLINILVISVCGDRLRGELGGHPRATHETAGRI